MERLPDILTRESRPTSKPPPLFGVFLLNDDYTPMEFVVYVLEHFFANEHAEAIQIMLKIHNQGESLCGIYPHGIAETKVTQVIQYARIHQHPLCCVMKETT